MGYGERAYGTGPYKYGTIKEAPVIEFSPSDDSESPEEGIDLKIDLNSNDLVISQGDLCFTSGSSLVMQYLQCGTLLFYGECSFNTEIGMDYINSICVKSPNLSTIKALFKDTILKTWKVTKLIDFKIDYNSRTRRLSVTFQADTNFGPVSYTVPQ